MSMRNISKKALAVVLSMAMLLSCMVFSFSASADTETLMWENDFSNGTADNWMKILGNSGSHLVSNGPNTKAIYDAATGAMKIDITHAGTISGFRMQSKDNSNGANATGGFVMGEGSYKVEVDYKLDSINDATGAAVDVCVGFAKKDYWYWDDGADKLRSRFEAANGGAGVYSIADTLTVENVGDGMQTATVYMDLDASFERQMHIFIKAGNNYGNDLAATVFIDNIKVYKVEKSGGTTPPPSQGLVSELKWENDFSNGTADNWMKQLGSATSSVVSNGPNTKAIYDAATGAMKIDINHAGTIAGFRFQNKDNSNGANATGVFAMGAGFYKVEIDYKLVSINDDAGAAVDVCVGFAKSGYWYWDDGADKLRSRFEAANGGAGVFAIADTLTAENIGDEMQTATVYMDLDAAFERKMHVFIKAGNNYGNDLAATVLVDNIKIYAVDKSTMPVVTFYYGGAKVGETSGIPGDAFTMPTLTGVPADCEYYSDEACTLPLTLPTTFPETSMNVYIKDAQPALPVNTVMWKNSFDNGTTSNWQSRFGAEDGNSSFNSGRKHTSIQNYAVLKAEEGSDNKVMALGFGNYASREYLSGFLLSHEETTHTDPTRAGYCGNYTGTNYAVGNFAAPLGSYKVTVDYNLVNIQTGDGPGSKFDLYVAFGDENFFWDGDKQLSRFTNYQKLATITPDDMGKGWQTATAYIENTTGNAMHVFIAQNSEYKNSLTGTELLVDNVEVSTSNYTSVVFYQDTTVVGQSDSAEPGTPFVMPTLTLPTGVPQGYELLYYTDAACTMQVELPTVYPNKSMRLYVKLVKAVNETWDFETEANGTRLSLNDRIPETTIIVDNTVKHNGNQSARVNSDAANGRSNLYAQMLVKNGVDQTVLLERGKNYEIKFWVYQPAAYGNYELSYWFAIAGDDTVFDADYESAHSRKNGTVAEGTFTPTATDSWQEVTVPIANCNYGGKLRIGIIGDKNNAHPFYIDDITVTEMSSEPNVWSFDYLAYDTKLSINTSDPGRKITVDNFTKYSGYNSVRVDGNTKLNDYFPQMMVKNDDGDQIYVYEGRNYTVKFRLYKPDTQPAYGFNYWLAATTEDVDKEFNRTDTGPDAYRANTYKIFNTSDVKYTAGEWVEVTIPITNCARTGKLRLGISGDYNDAHLFYIDDIVVTENTPDPDSRHDSFERYEEDQALSLNTNGATVTVVDEDRRSGSYSAKFVTTGSDLAAAPQMVVNNFRREAITVEKGKNYRISFWVATHGGADDFDLKFWLAAGDDSTAFTNNVKNALIETQTVDVKKDYVWQYVKAVIKDCPASGTLRLGITGTTDAAHTFFIDDLYAYEDTAGEPDPKAMNFEMYELGTNLALNQTLPDNDTYKWNKNSITIVGNESYTGGQSAFVYCNNNMQNNRPQMLVRDGEGNVIRVNKGDDFFVSFMMYVDPTAPYFSFGYWLAATPEEKDDTPFFGQLSDNPEFSVTDYILPGEKFEIMPPDPGVWTEIKIAVMDCPYSGSLRIGLCHGNAQPYESSFYIDDIKVYDPEYVTVKFDSNGSEDKYADITLMSDMLIPLNDYIDPYREGYEFLGWYTDKNFSKESFFEIYSTPVVGKTGDVITLYARWREWGENIASGDRPKDEVKFEYKTEYYEEKVWIGDQNIAENPYPTEGSALKEAAPVQTKPADDVDDGALPPWLIVVIIVGAVVVVGGGAVLAAVLLKKNKKA